jgi:hypothetical protein
MVQLSVLLCLIPLTLENAMMQAHVTQVRWRGGGARQLSLFAALPVRCSARAELTAVVDAPIHPPPQECLSDIIQALDNHVTEVDIQTKGLVLLGVLVQV